MKEMYNQAPDEWIVLWAIPTGWMNHGKWFKTSNPAFNEENHYKLIHIKHKQVLDAYLANGKVEIEYEFDEETYNNAGWYTEHNFIEHYEPDLEYRLKEKEDGQEYRDRGTSQLKYDSANCWDTINSADSNTISSTEMNSFTAHGFEVPSWEGELLKEVDDRYIGYILNKDNKATAITWNANGVSTLGEPDTVWQGFRENYSTNLRPIKQHWYYDPAKFPALITDGEDYTSCASQEAWLQSYYISEVNWKLATKTERDSLYVSEED